MELKSIVLPSRNSLARNGKHASTDDIVCNLDDEPLRLSESVTAVARVRFVHVFCKPLS